MNKMVASKQKPKQMKKDELIAEIAKHPGLDETIVRRVLDETLRVTKLALARGEEVMMFGLGKLYVVDRPAKMASNFGRGPVAVDAYKKVLLKPSAGLDDAVNKK